MIMERKGAVIKVENNVNVGSSLFVDHHVQSGFPLQGIFDSLSDQVLMEKSGGGSLGFMELLGLEDIGSPSLLDMVQLPYSTVPLMGPPTTTTSPSPSPAGSTLVSINNQKQQPGTPNSSSISSTSSEAFNDEVPATKAGNGEGEEGEVEEEREEEEVKKTKKWLKPKKINQKRQREPRFAFMTKSEVDHLEDGYRWRKYGQKAVKNSPHPRSYYRCTAASCNVKKRVERSFSDPSVVVTTYEGQHTHPSPVMIRSNVTGPRPDSGFSATSAFGLPMQMTPILYQQQSFLNNFSPLGGFSHNGTTSSAYLLQERLLRSTQGSNLLKDHGLLQDIVPSHMLKEE